MNGHLVKTLDDRGNEELPYDMKPLAAPGSGRGAGPSAVTVVGVRGRGKSDGEEKNEHTERQGRNKPRKSGDEI